MSAPSWLDTESLTPAGRYIIRSDMPGNAIGPAAPALGRRRSPGTWPAPFRSGPILVAANVSARRPERGYLLLGAVTGTLAIGGLFTAVPALSSACGLVEFWFARLLVDLVGVPLNFHSGPAFAGLVHGALVLRGMRDWWLRSRTSAEPAALEGAAT